MEAIILAGGFGTRLQSVVRDLPKPMADINGSPFLKYLLNYLFSYSVGRIILSVGYKWQTVQDFFGAEYREIPIHYVVEDTPLGTGGAIKESLKSCNEDDIVVLNGDSFFDVDLNEFRQKHRELKADLSMALKPMTHFDRYGTVRVEEEYVVSFTEKGYQDFGYINGGVYILRKDLLNSINQKTFSFELDFLQMKMDSVKMGAYISDTYFIDIGIPGDYSKAQKDLEEQFKNYDHF